jgi:Domain of unknown function (DUF4431)
MSGVVMRRSKRWACTGLVLGLMIAPALACMSDQSQQESAQGKLAIATKHDAAGRPEKVYMLTLKSPACLTASDPADNVKSTRTIHIFSSDEKVHAEIAKLVGRTVLVRGQPFAAHTAHHHAPIVMDIAVIGTR